LFLQEPLSLLLVIFWTDSDTRSPCAEGAGTIFGSENASFIGGLSLSNKDAARDLFFGSVVESKMRYHPRRDLPELQGVGGIAN
jgi:hypothetical protein